MGTRADDLHATADSQISRLIALLSGATEASLRRPCRGRDKLGDGTAGALAVHMTDNYLRIGAFVAGDGGGNRDQPADHARPAHHVPSHASPEHYRADNARPEALIERLSVSRERLRRITALSDAQLDTAPPQGSIRFADGRRTLEQVLTGLLRHQAHQLEAVAEVFGAG